MMKEIHLYIMKHEYNNIVNCSTWNTYKRQEKKHKKRHKKMLEKRLEKRHKIMLNFKLYKLNNIHLTVQPNFDIIHYRDVPYIHPFDRKRGF